MNKAHKEKLTNYRFIYGLFFITVFIATTIPTLVLMLLVPGEQRRRRVTKAAASLVFRLCGATPEVSGMDRLPSGPCMVVANHASYLDGILLTAVLPARFRFVIKREVTQVPLMHFLLRRTGAQFVERFKPREAAADARRVLQKARDGASLVVFPEGTFRREPGLRAFQPGAFRIASRTDQPLVPVVIRGSRAMLPAEQILPSRVRMEVEILEPVEHEAGADREELAARCRAAILDALDEPDLPEAGHDDDPRVSLAADR